ncbi:glycosyltransferase 87 family protein [Agrococcus sp. HG114]|uniref:glycosyltransferase 87 family protein n=1 Tax=Agrococcus sp. HG114 TaxID=2969757 RepID=UPI00215A4184|nr:glycosyltransferase 87 family protein [Agrococcus sp. HG114]MCR8670604.1 glycosyltransferase 87 family protein [Agrococcus sp. HG114]
MAEYPDADRTAVATQVRRRAQAADVADRMLTKRWLVRSFALLHGASLLALLPVILAGGTVGDLPLYREWAMEAFEGGPIVGIDADWVYPLLAWLPIGGSNLLGAALYQLLWFLMTAALNWWAVWVLSEGGRSRRGMLAAYTFMLGFLLLSPVALLRLEGITGPLVIVGLVWLSRRPLVAGTLLAVATWIKVWPAMVIGAVVAVHRERWLVVLAGLGVTVATAAVSAANGGLPHLLSFLTTQTDRALQLEAPIATPWVWLAALDVLGARVYQNRALATREVVGPLDGGAILLSTPLLLAGVAAICVLLLWARRRGADVHDLLLVGAFALVAASIVFNKVGSPQYLLWLLPVAAVAMLRPTAWWRRMTALLLVTSLLTTLVFPIFYMPLVRLEWFAVMLLSVRNALLVALLIAAVARIVQLGRDGLVAPPARVGTSTQPLAVV